MVVTVSPPGTDVGLTILKKGGNAVDAAVATAFAMAVTYPAAGNLGGGGFMVIHPPLGKGEPVVIDYREKAPLAANRKMYTRRDTWEAGDRFVQKDLAKTLRLIAEKGADGFYTGVVAGLFAAEMKRGHGLITKEDLAAYRARERTPIHGTYRGYDVYGPPPPS